MGDPEIDDPRGTTGMIFPRCKVGGGRTNALVADHVTLALIIHDTSQWTSRCLMDEEIDGTGNAC